MASIEVMKERARIAGRFNLSARRNPEHRALVALAAQRAGESAVIIVTEINGTFLFLLTCFTIANHDAMIST